MGNLGVYLTRYPWPMRYRDYYIMTAVMVFGYSKVKGFMGRRLNERYLLVSVMYVNDRSRIQ